MSKRSPFISRTSAGIVSFTLIMALVVGCMPIKAHAYTDGLWTPVFGSVSVANPKVVLLSNGNAVIAGSYSNDPTTPIQVYKQAANKWVNAPSLTGGRAQPAVAALSNRKALIAGGFVNGSSIGEAFILDEKTMTVAPATSLLTSVGAPAVVNLSGGRVALFGGYHSDELGADYIADTQIYNPATDSWSLGAPFPVGSPSYQNVLKLDDGRIMVRVGIDNSNVNNEKRVFIYDPVSDSWSETGEMPRFAGNFVELPSGKVIAFTTVTEIWDPVTNEWTDGPAMPEGGLFGMASALPDGDILITNSDGTFIYNEASDLWTQRPPFPIQEDWSSVLLHDGSLLVAAGGHNLTKDTDSFRYKPGGALSLDSEAPVQGAGTLSKTVLPTNQHTRLTVPVTDNASGVGYGYFYEDSSGNGKIPMYWDGANLTADINAGAPGVYSIYVAAVDTAGNKSAPTIYHFVSYNPDTEVTVAASTARFQPAGPTSEAGDTFPFMPAGANDRARLTLNAHYRANGTVAGGLNLTFRKNATNEIVLSNSQHDWLAAIDAARAKLKGTTDAEVMVGGVATTQRMQYVVDVYDASSTPYRPDGAIVRLYNLTDDVFTANPVYQLSGYVESGTVVITGIPVAS